MSTPLTQQMDQMAEAQELREEVERLRAERDALAWWRKRDALTDEQRRAADDHVLRLTREIERLRAQAHAKGPAIAAGWRVLEDRIEKLEDALRELLVWADDVIKYDCAQKQKARGALAAAHPKSEVKP